MSWKINILTLFPDIFPGALGVSVIGKALEKKIWSVKTFYLRDYITTTRIDDTPYGGGPGMLLRADVLGRAIEDILAQSNEGMKIIFPSPKGATLSTEIIADLTAHQQDILMICGRFEGIDQRIIDYYNVQEISIGDYVISGGEIAIMVILDACIRTLPGVVGNHKSLASESFNDGMLEYPQYTKPAVWNNMPVPEVLTSGNHQNIAKWRKNSSKEITKKFRPDLLHNK